MTFAPDPAEIRAWNERQIATRREYDPEVAACTIVGRPRRIGPRKPASVREAAVRAALAGEPQRVIAARVGVSQATISDWCIAARREGERS